MPADTTPELLALSSDLDGDLDQLSREELVSLIKAQREAGVRISFAGKATAGRLARKVRPRTQKIIKKHCAGTPEAQARNVVVEGDNLQALVTLYRERGQIDLIVTDPPYNTGNDFRYNDRWEDDPNDPGLGELVREDDTARHTKWMRFMWPRLQMMKSMLRPGGVLAICIDHRELFRLGQMLDELFREENRLAIINWQKSTAPRNDRKHVSTATEYVLVYAKDSDRALTGQLPRSVSANSRYRNPDDDPDGAWREHDLSARTPSPKDQYGIQSPFTGKIHYPANTRSWSHPKANIKAWVEEWGMSYVEQDIDDGRAPALMVKGGTPDRVPKKATQAAKRRLEENAWPFVWWGFEGTGGPRVKRYLESVRKGMVPVTYWADDDMDEPLALDSTSWDYEESGLSQTGIKELTAVVGPHSFETVKPLKLISKLIQIWCPPDGAVLDPFAGSGTAGHAVLALNASSDANRRFVLIEQGRPEKGDSYARTLTAERLRRVIAGDWVNGKGAPVDGGFHFTTLDKKVDATALLRLERDEMVDTVIASYFDATQRRGQGLVRLTDEPFRYLVARNSEDEGFFLVWDGVGANTDFDEDVYEACADEAQAAGLKPTYHVYARFNLYQTNNVRFYQIPDRILADFGLDLRSEPFAEDDE